ncbi:MAG: amidohydrolase family protein [Deltaproteobacteria bacterium]|nr:amidohydrolase family protein [Deltaproteobacteria bacterium]MBI3387448.1 amidohydrolase family protein [Deltaproteobacteria bacterium]
MARYDTVITGGMVVDGTRMPRRRCDVAITNGRIAKLGHIKPADATRVLDADGMIVAPGFVDLHTHYDAQVFWDPYCTLSGWHGVTSVVIGNCGFGFAPVRPDDRERAMRSMTRVEAIPYNAMKAGLPWDWITFPEFLDCLDRLPKSINVRPFMPVGPLLVWVLGAERAKAGVMPSEAEHTEMRRLLHEAMDHGAGGWSAQRLEPGSGVEVQRDFDGTPMVSDVMRDETCIHLAEVLAERNEGFIQMTLAKSDGTTLDHLATLAEVSGRPILWNVVLAFDNAPHVHLGQLAWLRGCHERGLPVYGQGVTTDAGFTFSFDEWNLFDEMQCWAEATTGTVAERLQKLSDPARRPDLRANRPWIALSAIENIVVAETFCDETKQYVNETIGDIAEQLGKDPVDVLLDIACADGLKATFFSLPANTTLAGFRDLMLDPYVIPGVSDGGAHTRFLTAGRYPTETIIRATRDNNVLSLEDVHWKLSTLPAYCAGFTDRGTLEEGKAADIVVYDFDRLAMTPVEKVHDFPANEWRRIQRAIGYRYVLVNGEVTIENDKQTGVAAGRLLRSSC